MDFVLPCELRLTTRKLLKFLDSTARNHRNIVHISCRSRKSVNQANDKPTDAMQFNRFRKSFVEFNEEFSPRRRQHSATRATYHTVDAQIASWSASSSAVPGRIDSFSTIPAQLRNLPVLETYPLEPICSFRACSEAP